jgi:DNA topoisomerase-2
MSLPIKRKNSMENTLDISQKYIKLEQHEHVLERPDMYIGSVQCDQVDTWIFKDENMLKSEIGYIPGLYKIFDEILVNSLDHSIRLSEQQEDAMQQDTIQVKNIKVNIDKETGIIQVLNDGDGIEVVLHDIQQVYIPELIFGNLLTSSNFTHDKERTIGGMNGIGAKACNIFSEFFEITTIDHRRKLKYSQRFEKNMTVKLKPKITKSSLKPYTSFRFKPDYAKFNCNGLSDDMYNLMIKRVYDACAMTRKVNSN